MNNYEDLTSKSIKQLSEWLNTNMPVDDSPWLSWFDNKYCRGCEPIQVPKEETLDKLGFQLTYGSFTTCAYCEIHKHCKYFSELPEVPDNLKIIELWLVHPKEN